MRFQDKVVLVTGGSQGIGEAVCRRFAAEGAVAAVVASASLAKAQGVADSIVADGGRASAHACDVTDVAALRALVAGVVAQHGRIDVGVAAAGVFYPTRVGETGEADFDRMCDINLKGAFFFCDAVAQHMIERGGGGRIINFGSAAGVAGRSNYIVYSATKAGVIHMTRSLGVALAPHGINVNAIAPGNTATPMNENVRTEPEYEEIRQTIARVTPSKRLFADAHEIAGAALFLASEDANAMYGATILMDEGGTAGY
jgi:NAD(P)-dependent dehydrogenase (short-subunit alcohol dehydrogenase family)